MPFKELTREIPDSEGVMHLYYVRQLPASLGVPFQFRIFNAIESVLPQLMTELNELGMLSGGGVEALQSKRSEIITAFLKIIGLVFANNDSEKLFTLIKDLVYTAKRDKQIINDGNFDVIYSGNEMELYKATFLVLEANFSNFISGLKANGLLDSTTLAEKQADLSPS